MNRFGSSFLYFFMCFVCFVIGNAQYSFGQVSRDSLNSIVLRINSLDKIEAIEAISYLQENIEQITDENSANYLAWVYEQMANAFLSIGAYNDSEESAVIALMFIDDLTDKESLSSKVRIQNILGILLRDQELYKESTAKYKESLSNAATATDSIYVVVNFANLYSEIKEFESAEKLYLLGFELLSRISKKKDFHRAKLLDNFGNMLSKVNSQDGLLEMKEALLLHQKLVDKTKIFSSYKHLTEHFIRNSNSPEALSYAKKAYSLSLEIPDQTFRRNALRTLIDLNQGQFMREYIKLADSLYIVDKKAQNKYASYKYDKSQFEKNALKSKIQLQRVLFAALLFIILTFILLRIILVRHKHQKKQAVLDTEQRIASDIHDGIANDLFLTMSKVDMETVTKEQVLDDLEEIYDKTRDISKANNPVELDRPFNKILVDLIIPFRNEDTQIVTKNISQISWRRISKEKKQTLYKVLQELLTNSKKYSNATLVLIDFSVQKSVLRVIFTDNGIGTNSKSKSGLAHAENRIRTLSGSITFESSPGKGFKAQIGL